MKVFVAGATGVLGKRALPLLVRAGHEVTALVRTPAKADVARALGSTPVVLDLFDAAAVTAAVAGHDVVMNLATHIPPLTKATSARAWEENARIRTVGSANLVDAALAGGATRYVQESIAFLYADGGDAWLDESATRAASPFRGPVDAAEANAARFTAAGGTGVVLRFGMFYGAGASHTDVQLRTARQGIAPVLGRADGYVSMIHLDDAASAVVAALDAPAGVYNIVEDRPGTHEVQAAAMGAALGAPPLWMPPAAAARAGGSKTAYLAASLRVSNRAFRSATRWAPAYPDPWAGWAQVVSATPARPPSRGRQILVKASLVYLAFSAALVGLWATFAPHSWFVHFPGLGRHWAAVDGPYNHHLVTDVGGLYLALLVLTVAAAGSRSRAMMRTAGAAWFVSALPHFLYHATHRHGLSNGDLVAELGGLGLQVVLGAVCVFAAAVPPRSVNPVNPAEPVPELAHR